MMQPYIMLRSQISLTRAERSALDAAAARTGRSVSALIRDAVDAIYVAKRSSDDDVATMRRAFGSWRDRELDSASLIDRLRSGSRLQQSD